MTDIDLSDLAADRDGSRPLRGYLASPAGTGPWSAVVMIHEIFGLDNVMRGHADRLAGLGYLTLAVDLFSAGSTARCLVTTMTKEPTRWQPPVAPRSLTTTSRSVQ
jgi:carboxymethylenebutenolidase